MEEIEYKGTNAMGKYNPSKSIKRESSNCKPKENVFDPEKVKKLIKQCLCETITGSYEEIESQQKAQKACCLIRDRVKEMGFDKRYKYVCAITVAEISGTLPQLIRCAWNKETDMYASYAQQSCSVFALAHCFAVLSS